MPDGGTGASAFFPRNLATGANSLPATNPFVEIQSDNYELRTNSAVFRNHVRAEERADEQLRGRLDCGLMTVTFSGTNELQQLVAENDVVIEQGDLRFTGGKAVYSGDPGLLELTD